VKRKEINSSNFIKSGGRVPKQEEFFYFYFKVKIRIFFIFLFYFKKGIQTTTKDLNMHFVLTEDSLSKHLKLRFSLSM
jgi:hypothetical protein